MKEKLIWNEGKTESGKFVKVLATEAMVSDAPTDLTESAQVLAVAVPYGESWKIYDMRNEGKMVRCGDAKTWPSLVSVKAYFEAR